VRGRWQLHGRWAELLCQVVLRPPHQSGAVRGDRAETCEEAKCEVVECLRDLSFCSWRNMLYVRVLVCKQDGAHDVYDECGQFGYVQLMIPAHCHHLRWDVYVSCMAEFARN
jgi:hypothetical protein